MEKFTWYANVVTHKDEISQDLVNSGVIDRVLLAICKPEDKRWESRRRILEPAIRTLEDAKIEVIPVAWWWPPDEVNDTHFTEDWIVKRIVTCKHAILTVKMLFGITSEKQGIDTEPYGVDRDPVHKADKDLCEELYTPVKNQFDLVFPCYGGNYDAYALLGKRWYTEYTYYHHSWPNSLNHKHDSRGLFFWPSGGQVYGNGRHKYWTWDDIRNEEPQYINTHYRKECWLYPGMHPAVVARYLRDATYCQIGLIVPGIKAQNES